MVKTNDLYYIDNGWKPGIIRGKYYWIRKPTDADAAVGRYRDMTTNKRMTNLPDNYTIVGPLMSANYAMEYSGKARTPERFEKMQIRLGEEPDYQGPTLDEVIVMGQYNGNNNPLMDSSDVQTWDDLKLYKEQLNENTQGYADEFSQETGMNHDAKYLNDGWEAKLVDGFDEFGNPRKEFRFVNPLTGEIGPMVSRWGVESQGLNPSDGVSGRYLTTTLLNMLNSFGRTDAEILKKATRNIEGDSSYDYINYTMGGVPNLLSLTHDAGSIAKAFRTKQSFPGFVTNLLFNKDFVDPTKSGDLGVFEFFGDGSVNWAKTHPGWSNTVNMIGDAVALGGGPRVLLRLPGNTARSAVGRGVNFGLGKVGLGTNWVKGAVNSAGKTGFEATKQVIRRAPGGSRTLSLGKDVLNTGKSAVNTVKSYIPLRVLNFGKNWRPTNLVSRVNKTLFNYPLTSNSRTGFKTILGIGNLGSAATNLFNGEPIDYFNTGKTLANIVTGIDTSLIDRGLHLYNVTDNVTDMFNSSPLDVSVEDVVDVSKEVPKLF